MQFRLILSLLCGAVGVLAACATGLSAAPGNNALPVGDEADVSAYVYGNGDGLSLPSQMGNVLAKKREQQVQRQEAESQQRAAQMAREIASAKPDLAPVFRPELPASPRSNTDHWRLAQLALALLTGIGISAAWNHFRQRRWMVAGNGPVIISVGGPRIAFANIGGTPAAAPAPRNPLRGRGRRRIVAPRKVRGLTDWRRDPYNESLRRLAGLGILPKWVRDLSPVLSESARQAGAIDDDLRMFSLGGDAIPNYAYEMDPVGMAQSAARAREASAAVWGRLASPEGTFPFV